MRKPFSLSSLVTAAAFCIAGAASVHGQGYSHVVAFGDSLTDQGNTIGLFGFGSHTEYDQDYYDAASNDYGIPAHGRFSNGPTWVEYLNGKLIGGGSSAPVALGRYNGSDQLTGTNFAWAGSTSGEGYSKLFLANLQTQIGTYSGSTFAPAANTTLFSVWSGGNDAIDWVKDAAGVSLEEATTAAAQNIATAIESLYGMGGRSFVVPNLPALGFKPDFIGTGNELLANSFAEMFNTKLTFELASLNLDDLTLFEIDIYSIFNDILTDPEAYGFTVTDEMAFTYDPNGSTTVANPWEYVFWDNTHPTSQMHEILGDLAYRQMMPIPEPSTYALIGVGAGLGFWARRRRLAA